MSASKSRIRIKNGANRLSNGSRQNPTHHLAVNIGQPEIAPLKTIRELFVIDAQAMENGRVLIVNVHRVLDDVVAVVVRFAVGDARP